MILVVAGWLVVTIALSTTATVALRWCPNPLVAAVQLLAPWWSLPAALVAVIAALTSRVALAVAAVMVVSASLAILVPKLRRSRDRRSEDIEGTPTTVALANLYLENEEPAQAIQQLLDASPDILVMTELTEQLIRKFDELGSLLAAADRPTIALGDFNSGTLQPPYERVLRTSGFRDGHDELGVALRPSWGVAPWLPRWFPTLVARLDHLLLGPRVTVHSLDDLDPVGSDHRPFVASIFITGEGVTT